MRLDRYLYFIRLFKSRTGAQALIAGGRVRVDGHRVTRQSEEVRVGSTITLPLHDRVRVIRVLALPARRGPAPEARTAWAELIVDGGDPAA